MKSFLIGAVIVLVIGVSSCYKKPSGDFSGWNEYALYMKERHHIKTDTVKDLMFYNIGIDQGCLCTHLNLTFVRDSCKALKSKLQIVLIGDRSDYNDSLLIQDLRKSGYQIIQDPSRDIFKYGTGFGKPIFVHYENGKGVYGKNVNDLEIGQVAKYIKTL